MFAGQVVILDQLDDATETNGIVNSSLTGTFGTDSSGHSGRPDGATWRSQNQIVKIVTVDDATHITITPGLYMPNWRSGQSPEVWAYGTAASDTIYNPALEDFTVINVNWNPNGQNSNIQFLSTYGGRIHNIRSLNGPRNHFGCMQCAHLTIQSSYFYGSVASNSESYAIETMFSTGSDNLYANNIFHRVTAPIIGPCVGCVVSHNYTFYNYYTDGGGCTTGANCDWQGLWIGHDSGGGYTLMEGNYTNGQHADANHGNSPLSTLFRNYLSGRDDAGISLVTKDNYRVALILRSFARAFNVIGNVLGTPSLHADYTTEFVAFPDLDIYALGKQNGLADDALVKSSLLRWGNYDTVTNAVRWCGNSSNTGWSTTCSSTSEVPTTGITYINGNAVPSTETLPASFYLSSAPAYWVTPYGTPAWPPIGPEVTGGNVSGYGNRVHKIPAKLCFENLADDPAYPSSSPRIKSFSATACYLGAPPPPTSNIKKRLGGRR